MVFHVTYLAAAFGVLFLRRWARNTAIYLPIIVFVGSWVYSLITNTHFSEQEKLSIGYKVGMLENFILLSASGYLLLPKVKKFFV